MNKAAFLAQIEAHEAAFTPPQDAERADVYFRPVARLLPRHRFGLWPRPMVLEAEEGLDPARFLRLWEETWRRLPLYARRAILGLWKTEGLHHPRVRFLRRLGWHDVMGNELAVPMGAVGSCGLQGRLVRFSSDWFDILTDEAARIVIAHELAHVFIGARGWTYEGSPADRDNEEHEDVSSLLFGWGFDEDVLNTEISAIPMNERPNAIEATR